MLNGQGRLLDDETFFRRSWKNAAATIGFDDLAVIRFGIISKH